MHRAHHNPQGAVNEHEVRDFMNQHNPRSVFFDYLNRRVSGDEAIKHLKRTNAEGTLWAGEIALEQSYLSETEEDIYGYLFTSKEMFDRAFMLDALAKGTSLSRTGLLAKIQASQLPVHQQIMVEKKLPSHASALKTYTGLVELGNSVFESGTFGQLDHETWSRLSGDLGRISVQVLLKRLGLQIGSGTLASVFTSFSENHRNTGPDIDVLWGSEYGPSVGTRVRVNNSAIYSGDPDSGVRQVIVNEDLRVHDKEGAVAKYIIRGAYRELFDPDCPAIYSDTLDQRTVQLADKLELFE